jgi:hypothetical protein
MITAEGAGHFVATAEGAGHFVATAIAALIVISYSVMTTF